MKVYECVNRFFCGPLKQWIPVGAMFARYENITKMVVNLEPNNINFVLWSSGTEYTEAKDITWLYVIEPPPLGTNTKYLTLVSSLAEDPFGNITSALPVNGDLQIGSDGKAYLKDETDNLFYPIRVNNLAGVVAVEVGQAGVVTP